MTPVLWTWCPIDVSFKPRYQRSSNEFGAQSHEYGSAYWMCEFTMPPVFNEATRRAMEKAIHTNDGRGLFGVFDRRCPYPLAHGPSTTLTSLTVISMNKATSTLEVSANVGAETLSVGDPIAFTYLNRRYYFKVTTEVSLSKLIPTTVEVMIRPRVTAIGMNVAAERVKPVAYFNVDVNPMEGQTTLNGTPITLSGVEYWGDITP